MIRLEIYPSNSSALGGSPAETSPVTPLVPHLPASLSFEFLRENPLFNRRGDYTYDIDISLRDPHNRAIYAHIDRLTATSRPQNRRARLLCDGRVIADGTEVILSIDNDNVKLQILAGTSEMNYLNAIANDTMIRDLNLGSMMRDTYQANAIYPQSNYTFPLIEIPDAEDEEQHFRNIDPYRFMPHDAGYGRPLRTRVHRCPFVLAIIEKVITALGYTLRNNELAADPRWRRLVLIHGANSEMGYAQTLPNWTVNEFFEQVEAFFDCIIIQQDGAVDILKTESFYKNTDTVTISGDDIEDTVRKDFTKDSSTLHLQRANLRYDLGSEIFGALNNFNPDTEAMCQKKDSTLLQMEQGQENSWVIYHEPNLGFDFVDLPEKNDDEYLHRKYIIKQFDQHKEQDAEAFELKIIPAEIKAKTGTLLEQKPRTSPIVINTVGDAILLLPQIQLKEIQNNRTWEAFADNIASPKEQSFGSTMQVAFIADIPIIKAYNESRINLQYYNNHTMLQCWTTLQYLTTNRNDRVSEYIDYSRMAILPTDATYDLRLNGPTGRFAQSGQVTSVIDITHEVTIRFRCRHLLDPIRRFLINNRLFICQQLKYTYADGRQHPIVEGTFFPYV